jgi:hypothetical protein
MLTAPAVPTLAGKVNEIAWAIVVEAVSQATAIWRGVCPRRRAIDLTHRPLRK